MWEGCRRFRRKHNFWRPWAPKRSSVRLQKQQAQLGASVRTGAELPRSKRTTHKVEEIKSSVYCLKFELITPRDFEGWTDISRSAWFAERGIGPWRWRRILHPKGLNSLNKQLPKVYFIPNSSKFLLFCAKLWNDKTLALTAIKPIVVASQLFTDKIQKGKLEFSWKKSAPTHIKSGKRLIIQRV